MLKADKTFVKNGIPFNKFIITQHNEYCAAIPVKKGSPQCITVYYFPEVPIKSYISLAEFYSRQVYYNNFRGFVPHFFVDSISIWQLKECEESKEIIIVMCGEAQKTKIRVVNLIGKLLGDFSLKFNNIKFVNKANSLIELFDDNVKSNCAAEATSCEHQAIIENIDRAAHCNFEVYFNSQWQQPVKGKSIQAIRISVNEGELTYRTHLINGGWLPWVQNGESSGSEKSYIDGFQINYISQKNILYYRFSTINSKPISWRSTNIAIPTKHYIDGFEFKIENIE